MRVTSVLFACFLASILFFHDVKTHAEFTALTTPEDLRAQGEAALALGEVFTVAWKDRARSDGAVDVYGVVEIAAPVETVWAVMTDCAASMKIVRGLRHCETVKRAPDGAWDVRRHRVKAGLFLSKMEIVFRSDYDAPHQIRISRAGGDMKVQNALWTLTRLADGRTRVTYRAASRPKFAIPGFMLRRAMRRNAPEILQNLQQEAEKRAS